MKQEPDNDLRDRLKKFVDVELQHYERFLETSKEDRTYRAVHKTMIFFLMRLKEAIK